MRKYSKEWVLQDTINFYNINNRAEDTRSCQYLTNDGRKCAIGRYLKPGLEETVKGAICGVITFIDLYPEIIPKWMMKLDHLFLNEIQKLHDEFSFWTETGLSKNGIRKVKEICAAHKIDFNKITIKE